MYRNSSCLTGEEVIAVFIFNHTETVVVQLQAKNCVHTQNKSQRLHVEWNRKSSPQVRVNPTWQPPSCCSRAHSPADNGEKVCRAPAEQERLSEHAAFKKGAESSSLNIVSYFFLNSV